MSSTNAPGSTGPGLRRVLGVPALVLFGLVYMVPLTVFTTYGLVTQITGGRVPAAYLITLAVMAFTALSYARMVRAFPYAGSAYTYTQKSFGPGLGFMAGWSLLLDYLFLPTINYLLIGIYLHAAVPAVPPWVFILAAIALVTALNVVGIVSVTRANFAIIAAQGLFIVVFLALGLGSLSGHVDLLAPFTGDGTVAENAALFTGAAVLCLSFLGFDAVSALAEEAKDARRDVPRAIVIATISAGLLYVLLSYVAQLVFPSNDFSDVDSGALDVMLAAGGQLLATLFTAAYIAGCLGSAVASKASVSRILFSMGRDGVLPTRVFGRLWARFATPVGAILVVAAVSLMAVVVDLALIAEMISFGALAAFSAVNLSVVKHYYIDQRRREGVRDTVVYLVLPGTGFLLTVWLWTSLAPFTLLIGLTWMAVGLAYLAWVTRGFRRSAPTLDLTENAEPADRDR